MALRKQETYWSMLSILFIVFQFLNHVFSHETIKRSWHMEPKGTLKTIKIGTSDIIDCVDIYKQPAFDHSLIKHLEMEPNFNPFATESNSNTKLEVLQDWHKYGECPDGTIPIRRKRSSYGSYHKNISPDMPQQANLTQSLSRRHEYGVVVNQGEPMNGAGGKFNIWNPATEDGEYSVSKMWIFSNIRDYGLYKDFNSIEVGWTVNPIKYHDKQTRFSIYWTRDGYKSTGCYDLDCPGFVQINKNWVLGYPIQPISQYSGVQSEISIEVFKEKVSGVWWLQVQGHIIGYWSPNIWTDLRKSAYYVQWGGNVLNTRKHAHHTYTLMGSGRFPANEGFSKSCYIRNLKVIDGGFNKTDPMKLEKVITNPKCYDLTLTENKESTYETYIFFGGSGFSSDCP